MTLNHISQILRLGSWLKHRTQIYPLRILQILTLGCKFKGLTQKPMHFMSPKFYLRKANLSMSQFKPYFISQILLEPDLSIRVEPPSSQISMYLFLFDKCWTENHCKAYTSLLLTIESLWDIWTLLPWEQEPHNIQKWCIQYPRTQESEHYIISCQLNEKSLCYEINTTYKTE